MNLASSRQGQAIHVYHGNEAPATPENRGRDPLARSASGVRKPLIHQAPQPTWDRKRAKDKNIPESEPQSPCELVKHLRQKEDWKRRCRHLLRKPDFGSFGRWGLPIAKESRVGPLRSKRSGMRRVQPKEKVSYARLASD